MPKKPSLQDPFAAREAEKYDRPIPSRELILEVLEKAAGPLNHAQLCRELGLADDEEQVEALRRRLRAMERDGQLMRNRRDAYCLVAKLDLIRGRVQGHRDGFGFVIPEDGSDDLYLSSRQMSVVFDGDEVLVRESGVDRRGRREGAIVEVLAHNTQQIVGRFFLQGDVGAVSPENPRVNHDILIPRGDSLDARDGQYVMVVITQQPDWRNKPRGRVVEVLGDHMAPGMEVDVAIRSYDIPFQWPDAALAEAQALAPEPSEEDKQHRIDIRQLALVTIDGEDARDFDDAVYCEPKKGGGWRLWVAIADVSHYVRPGSALDREAQLRGNSVYFPDRVVPMLPEALSNGLCSLKPKVDRLCMVCEMTISASGKLTGSRFFEGVMHSRARLTYNIVAAMLDPVQADHQKWRTQYQEVVPHVEELHRLYLALRQARDERGAIDFETVETKVVFSRDRKIERIVPVVRNDAHKLIEECMLAANVATAQFMRKHEIPSLYRVHDGPPPERLEKLKAFLTELGLSLHRGKEGPTPKDYQKLLESIRERPDFHLIQTVMLRSLSQAVYSADNNGHFGLNYEAYTHFTSPIRRYPDLLVHRAIRSVVRSRLETPHVQRAGAASLPKAKIYPYDEAALEQLGEQCSMTERRADEATRDVVNWLKCEFMKDRVGESFAGVITAVTGFGIFVELRDIYVEGLVHVTALPADYYHFDPVHHRLSGERSGRSFRLGDSVEVTVMRVDLDERKIDFELSQAGAGKASAGRSRNAASARGKGEGPAISAKPVPGNTDVQKSREVKKALLAGSKGAGKPASGRQTAGRASGKGAAAPGKTPPAAAKAAGQGKPRKRKAKA